MANCCTATARQVPVSTTPTRPAVTCRQWMQAPTVVGLSGPMPQHLPQAGTTGSQTSPPEAEDMVGKIPSIKVPSPDSGRMMGKARIQRVQPRHEIFAQSTLTGRICSQWRMHRLLSTSSGSIVRCAHRRRWLRLIGKPVRRFRRHVRYFVKRRGKKG